MAKNKNTEQMRRLTNSFVLAGPIAEIEDYKFDKTKDGVPYISFKGIIRCGEDPVYDQRFKIFSTARKKDIATGEMVDRPNFKKLKEWCDSCIPLTKSKEDATWAEIGGFIGMNDYVNREGKLIESCQFNVNWTRLFEDYKTEINFESYLQGMRPETRGEEEEETGRTRIRLVGTDIYGNAVDMKNIIADEEVSGELNDAGYGVGAFATYFISLIPTKSEPKKKAGGIGQQRTTQGRAYLEWMLVGADPIIEEDDENNFVEPSVFKGLMNERKARLDEIKENGYLGGSGSGEKKATSSSGTKSGGVGKKNASANTSDEDDDADMPF